MFRSRLPYPPSSVALADRDVCHSRPLDPRLSLDNIALIDWIVFCVLVVVWGCMRPSSASTAAPRCARTPSHLLSVHMPFFRSPPLIACLISHRADAHSQGTPQVAMERGGIDDGLSLSCFRATQPTQCALQDITLMPAVSMASGASPYDAYHGFNAGDLSCSGAEQHQLSPPLAPLDLGLQFRGGSGGAPASPEGKKKHAKIFLLEGAHLPRTLVHFCTMPHCLPLSSTSS